MKSEEVFSPLHERLKSFEYPGTFTSFDYGSVLRHLEASIFKVSNRKYVLKKIEFYHEWIARICRDTPDLSVFFEEREDQLLCDLLNAQHGETFLSAKPVYSPVTDPYKRNLYHEYTWGELNAYTFFLITKLDILAPETQVLHTFKIKHPNYIIPLFDKLCPTFINPANLTAFKSIVGGGEPPRQKVDWIAGAASLNYAFVALRHHGLVTADWRNKQSILEACFLLDGSPIKEKITSLSLKNVLVRNKIDQIIKEVKKVNLS